MKKRERGMARFWKKQLFAMAASVLVLSACDEPAEETPEVVRPIQAIKVSAAGGLGGRSYPGRAKATQEVDLSFRVGGPLIALPANVGDEVEAGQVVAQIDPRDYEVRVRDVAAQLAQAKATLESMRTARPEEIRQLQAALKRAEAVRNRAQAEHDRIMEIVKADPGIVTKTRVDRLIEGLDTALAEYRAAEEALNIGQAGARKEDIAAKEAEIRSLQASLDSANDQVDYTTLSAPFGGAVATTFVENFEEVTPGQPIVRLVDTTRIEMIINVPENTIALLPKIEEVMARFDAFPDTEIHAKIKEIGKEASETTRTYPVTLVMDQPPGLTILAGMAGKAYATAEMAAKLGFTGLEIPASAVFSPEGGKQSFVWVIDEKTMTVSKREIETTELSDTGIRIGKGLKAGEWIAAAGVHYLREGQKVRFLDAQGG
jgi:RND family efflux transporter MFP subunit